MGMSPGRAIRYLVKRALYGRWLAVLELRNKLNLGLTALAMRRLEDAEVARLASEMEPLPPAKVATVIPTYRRPDELPHAVRSALDQTIRDHVVIVIDDGGGVLPELPTDPRLRVCSLSKNTAVVGIVNNIGMRLTRSTYVAFLADDNEWEPNHLEAALAALETGSASDRPDLVYTALLRLFPDGRLMDVLSIPFDRRQLAREGYVDGNAVVIRRFRGLHYSRIRRPRGIAPREDWELVYRLSRRRRTLHVPVPTVRYQVNPESYWSDWPEDLVFHEQA
jgi:glycosyltransferase involved in cell wall biosynthesis